MGVKEVEKALNEWVDALDAIEYPIFMHDREFRILRCNRAYQLHAELPFQEIIGRPYYELFPKNDGPMHHCLEALECSDDEGSEEEIQVDERFFFSRGVIIKDDNGNYLYSLHILKDVTEQRKIEQALRESEGKFRALVESTSDWIWEINAKGLYTYISPRVEELLGYTPEEVLGKSPFDFMTPEEVERIGDEFQKIIADCAPLNTLQNVNRCKDGTLKILETSGLPFFNEQGDFLGYRGIDRDVTARIHAEEHLRESEIRYRTLFEAMLNGFAYCQMIYDEGRPADFIYLEVNKAFEQQTGLKNVIGKRLSEVVPGIRQSDPELFERYVRVASGGKSEQFETYVKSLNMWFFISLYCPMTGYFVAVFDVITERKLAEETLKNEVTRRRIMMESSHDGIAVIDKDFKIVEANACFENMIGYTPEEILDLHIWDFEALMNEHEIRNKFLDIGSVNTTIETRHRRKNGTLYDAEVSISGVIINGEPMTFTITRDITERKKEQNALMHANRALKTLSAGNMALVRANDEQELLQQVTDIIKIQAGYNLAVVVYANNDATKSITMMASSGMEDDDYEWLNRVTWDDTSNGQFPVSHAIRSGMTQVYRNNQCIIGCETWRESIQIKDYTSNIALPLFDGKKVFGALCIYSSKENSFEDNEIRLLEELSGDLAFGVITLRTRIAHDQQAKALRQSLEQSIQIIAATVEARDPYTAGHQRRVSELASAIAQEIGLSEEEVQGIHFAALIHDLGKIHIPAEILVKPGRLSEIEFMLIKTHPQEGYNILKDVKFPWPIADTILQHHEKIDGSGYPQGLKGEDILIGAKIICVADVVEAMSSHRPYRASLGIEPSLDEIRRGRGTWYDSTVVDACLTLFEKKGFMFTSYSG
ncbi:MAG: PAS domain S-box protein [Sulfuricurvum sp.]|uniref:PAS domain S-box protein n=1 Tax=Sulfuricurvum sp. TaxID=2025608 RepID=UPI00260531D4|nr:PAS domain S-box protein [Sulfuricurvum sp.]MDD5117947.1 PAS domain S-box protein [Sulfuricurvum sp.]MDD5160193.1 PAS domain S-box protein [Sulfuricurvum sp.]